MAVHPGSIWLEQNWSMLTPGLWVAATAGGIVSEGTDYDVMLAAVVSQGINLAGVTIVYVPVGIVQ